MTRIATLMALEAASLVVMSTLHLTGVILDDSGQRSGAGIPEGVIAVALAAGALALLRRLPNARAFATGTLVFAIAGFLIGLSFTIGGGTTLDLVYHAVALPLLVLTLALLRRPALARL